MVLPHILEHSLLKLKSRYIKSVAFIKNKLQVQACMKICINLQIWFTLNDANKDPNVTP